MNVKKFVFPLSCKETSLKNYWWHRLFAVIFFILLIATPVSIFLKLNNVEIKSRDNCLSFNPEIYSGRYEMVTQQRMRLENNKSSYDINSYNVEQDRLQREWDNINKEEKGRIDNCFTTYPIHNKLNLGLALLSTILLWYLLQIIYYKVLLYVVLGSNKN